MRSFTLKTLEPEAFDAFSAAHPQGNFQQTSRMGRARATQGVDVRYLGVEEAGALVAAVQLEIHPNGLATFAEIHDGPLCDLGDRELAAFLFSEVKRIARRAGAAQVEVTPEVPYRVRDAWGRPLPEPGSDEPWPRHVPAAAPSTADDAALASLTAAGLVHAGFDTGYTAVPRWRFVKDLTGIADEKALMASYEKKTLRNNVRLALSSGVQIVNATRDELGTYHDICEISCERQGFENRPLSYFETLYDALGDSAEFKIAYIDFAAYLASWQEKRAKFQAQIEHVEGLLAATPGSRKAARQLDDARVQLGGAEKRIAEAKRYIAEVGERVPAAAAMFAWHPRECVYLFSGSDPRYARFYPAIAIQHHMMLECIERGCTRYNFYGVDGVFDDPDDPGRGLLEFKQGFGGYVEELLGEFTLPVRPAVLAAKRLAHRVLGR